MLVLTGDSVMGLAIVRSLGRRGLRVVVATALPDGTGRYSRYCSAAVSLPPLGPDLAGDLLWLADSYGVDAVVATSEELIVALNAVRARLEPRLRLLFPPARIMATALHKDRTLEIARKCGVAVPRTVHPASSADVERCRGLPFPVVIKPARRDGADERLRFKLEHLEDFASLEARLRDFEGGAYPLVQEHVPGHGVGVEALCRDGEPLLLFQHRRVRELPPDGGFSVLCESVALDPELRDAAARLLRAMRWSGVAMVEFRRDPATGRTVLMEVNGRFWGSLPLALHAGADFPALLHAALTGDVTAPPPYRVGVRCRDLVGDTRWLATVLRHGGRPRTGAVLAYLASFDPRVRHFAWALDDPWPALAGWWLRARKGLGRLLGGGR